MKNIIITGATSGLGLETAKKVAATSTEYRLILACRNQDKAESVRQQIIELSGNPNVLCLQLDTSSLLSVQNFAHNYLSKDFGNIHALVCNAGISGSHTGNTQDGYDILFETNHLGHFLLTKLLLTHMENGGKIFSTSSDMHDPFNAKLVWKGAEALAHPDAKLAQSSTRYSYSKLCNLYFIYELARQIQQHKLPLYANAFNPGLMKTNFMPLSSAAIESVKLLMPKRFGNLETSSAAYAQLITNDAYFTKSGQYFDRSTQAIASSKLSYCQENAEELWNYSEQCVCRYY